MRTIVFIGLFIIGGFVGGALMLARELGSYCEDINPYNEDIEK